ncbi:MAG TPA: radical SAM family heme chaperone HemW [Thermoanaerobaculia bacterium]|jgi:oxygen-independent coproporphyrinogen-3 oxidase|nr:radical SAM family heme chaperone HemW [Thermoanaerobaculia bacterium]
MIFGEARPGLYLHIPFCSAICPYCDFAVLTGGLERRRRFVSHLLKEIAFWSPEHSAFEPIDTIYFGGGTPSALESEDLASILAIARESLTILDTAEVFFEANPEDVTVESVRAWRDLGVRFLSLGVQSFDADALKFLGRRHTPEQARRSVEIARAAGFDTVSIDLIYGLPDQPFEVWRRTLEEAVALAPDHLSCYQLTIHEGTPFGFRLARGKMSELPEEAQAKLFLFTHEFLRDHGYPGYEVSNFARSIKHRSRHNQKYWQHVPYLGLGPSAHSFSGNRRWWNERKLKPYEARIDDGEKPIAGTEELTRQDLALEALMLGLRTTDGIDLDSFRERYGVELRKSNEPLVERLASEGLLKLAGSVLIPTLAGLAVTDSLARAFELGSADVRPTSA